MTDSLETSRDVVSEESARALHGLLDAPGPAPAEGDPVPPLWHWLAFLPRCAQRELGADGHPKSEALFHQEEYPRRMFAGGRVSFEGVARVGETLTRRSRVGSVIPKSGRSGELLIVTLEHEIGDSHGVIIRESQDLVYRPAVVNTISTEQSTRAEITDMWRWQLSLATDPPALFRFSALTYNSHRIHYDRDYATKVEGYPGLVVQGPYQAIGLAEICRRNLPDLVVQSFEFRAVRPAFDGGGLKLRGSGEESRVTLAACDDLNRVTMRASAGLAT